MSTAEVQEKIIRLTAERAAHKAEMRRLTVLIAAERAVLRPTTGMFYDGDPSRMKSTLSRDFKKSAAAATQRPSDIIAPSSPHYTTTAPTEPRVRHTGTVAEILAAYGIAYLPEYETSPPKSPAGWTNNEYCNLIDDWQAVAFKHDKL